MSPRRKWLLVAIGSALLMVLALMYSLVGAMTGVYSCPSVAMLGPGTGYLVRRGDEWHWVLLGNGAPTADILDRGRIDIDPGIWSVSATLRGEAVTIRAYAPWNLADVYRLTFGGHRSLGRGAAPP